MTELSPITPPPELRRQWLDNDDFLFVTGTNDLLAITRDRLDSVINQCATWAADQELEACCSEVAWLESTSMAKKIRDRRRPKPPSLKEQALEAWEIANQSWTTISDKEVAIIIRRALEALPND
jgi:type II secretory pathway component PulL